MTASFHATLDTRFGFTGYEPVKPAAPHQSSSPHVRFPGAAIAAAELGVHRGHLHRVLSGQRQSMALLARWQAWLKQHPEFAALQHPAGSKRRARA